ncbi:MAG TPA: hypothetical protein PLU71_04095 [Candidatus Dependentiae bacterium]|nr:hypothetical protein [Candidatus Dependentiae bacterium]HRQ63014.1 hypothetical protein [Candidatus Dependentiae bacterium]
MKKLAISILIISTVISAQTPQQWDTALFTDLQDASKKFVIGHIQATSQVLGMCADATEKGADAFLESYNMLMQYYTQIATGGFIPFNDEYKEVMLPAFPALAILPTFDIAWKKIEQLMPHDEQDLDKALKRATNKALRNKTYKSEIKKVFLDQVQELQKYVDYINTHYTQLVNELKEEQDALLAEFMKQMQP